MLRPEFIKRKAVVGSRKAGLLRLRNRVRETGTGADMLKLRLRSRSREKQWSVSECQTEMRTLWGKKTIVVAK